MELPEPARAARHRPCGAGTELPSSGGDHRRCETVHRGLVGRARTPRQQRCWRSHCGPSVCSVTRSGRERLRGTPRGSSRSSGRLGGLSRSQYRRREGLDHLRLYVGQPAVARAAPRTSIMPNSFAIGLGLPHALGAAVGSQVPPVVLLAGDGGFLLSAGELATVAQEDLPIVVVVFVDGGYGVLGNIQESQYGPEKGASEWTWGGRTSAGSQQRSGSGPSASSRSAPTRRQSSGPSRTAGPAWWRWTSMRSAR